MKTVAAVGKRESGKKSEASASEASASEREEKRKARGKRSPYVFLKANRKPEGARFNPYFLPLVCVFQPHDAVRDYKGNVLRRVFVAKMCCKVAKRDPKNMDQPLWPNRFGEPLCSEHRHTKNDRFAFPDDVKDESAWNFGGIFLSEEQIEIQAKRNRKEYALESGKMVKVRDKTKEKSGRAK